MRPKAILARVATLVLACSACLFALSGSTESFWPSHALDSILAHFGGQQEFVSRRMQRFPSVYLWAWERPEDLRFLHGRSIGVAFLAKTLFLRNRVEAIGSDAAGGVEVRPRMQPLRVAAGTPLMAVVRIETPQRAIAAAFQQSSGRSQVFAKKQVVRSAEEIADAARLPGVNALQIDFDATLGERAFYSALLTETRKHLPADLPLTITALASWCIGDRWLDELPPGTIDEAVPMLFRMGPGTAEVVNLVRSRKQFPVAVCKDSIGISMDEAFSRAVLTGDLPVTRHWRASKRIYLFSPQGWDPKETAALLQETAP